MRNTRNRILKIEARNGSKIEAMRHDKAIKMFYASEHGERFLEAFFKLLEDLTGASVAEYIERFDHLKTMVLPKGFDPDVDAFHEAYDLAFWELGDPLLDIYDELCS